MLVTIGLLVLVVSFELPFWVVVIGCLEGQIPNGSPMLQSPNLHFHTFDFMAKSL
jgi:hypothetical protein